MSNAEEIRAEGVMTSAPTDNSWTWTLQRLLWRRLFACRRCGAVAGPAGPSVNARTGALQCDCERRGV